VFTADISAAQRAFPSRDRQEAVFDEFVVSISVALGA
jgi:hypothetical protein